jgi:hypothetical protein
MLQDLLTSTIVMVTVGFAFIAVYDFFAGLLPATTRQNEKQPNPQQVCTEQSRSVATLEWLVSQLPVAEEEQSEPVDILALARERVKSAFDLAALKIYKLRGESVVHIADIPFSIPAATKRYKLRGRDVIKLAHLEKLQLA